MSVLCDVRLLKRFYCIFLRILEIIYSKYLTVKKSAIPLYKKGVVDKYLLRNCFMIYFFYFHISIFDGLPNVKVGNFTEYGNYFKVALTNDDFKE